MAKRDYCKIGSFASCCCLQKNAIKKIKEQFEVKMAEVFAKYREQALMLDSLGCWHL